MFQFLRLKEDAQTWVTTVSWLLIWSASPGPVVTETWEEAGVKYFYQIGFIEQTKVIRFAECYQEFNQVSIFLSGEIKPDRYINYNKYIYLKRIIIRRLTLFPELIVWLKATTMLGPSKCVVFDILPLQRCP